jgi:photosystem II stability/assembly factor-like uncharacterized protein
MATSTYRVSRGNEVHRLDSPSNVWVDISPMTHGLPGATQWVDITDVQTVPNQPDWVFICGDVKLYPNNPANNFYGIAWSHDKGVSWFQPVGGNYTNGLVDTDTLNKLWIVNPSVVYITGPTGKVFKTIDGGLTFNACTPLTWYGIQYAQTPVYDPKTGEFLYYTYADTPTQGMSQAVPVHFRDPMFGIVGTQNNVAITQDGGVTWTNHTIHMELPGLTVPGQIYGNHISADGQQIVVVGYFTIEKSYDGGLTWIQKYVWNTAVGFHLTWTDDTHFFAFGSKDEILRSDDGGDTWQVVKPNNPSGPHHKAGHFYQFNKGFYSDDYMPGRVFRTTDGCQTNADTWTFVNDSWALWTSYEAPSCYLLTPCDRESQIEPFIINYAYLENFVNGSIMICAGVYPFITECTCFTLQNVECIGQSYTILEGQYTTFPDCNTCEQDCYRLVDCEDEQHIIYTSTNLSAYVGHVIHLAASPIINPATCWTVYLSDCGHTLTPTTFFEDAGTCEECVRPCYMLRNCENRHWIIITDSDFSDYVDHVVYIANFHEGSCWTVEISPNCFGTVTVPTDQITQSESCECCSHSHFLLTDCNGILPPVITCTDLSDYVGEYVQFNIGDTCWLVSTTLDCSNTIVPEVLDSFGTCEECTPVIPPVVIPNNVRSVKPGYDTPGCDPEYTEKVNCKFANAIYNQMTITRYGVKMCCNLDVDKWSIKKSLLDMKAVYDPTACCTVVEPPCCPECPPAE